MSSAGRRKGTGRKTSLGGSGSKGLKAGMSKTPNEKKRAHFSNKASGKRGVGKLAALQRKNPIRTAQHVAKLQEPPFHIYRVFAREGKGPLGWGAACQTSGVKQSHHKRIKKRDDPSGSKKGAPVQDKASSRKRCSGILRKRGRGGRL